MEKELPPKKELYNYVKQDDLYFRAAGGGVTFGGGEPLLFCKDIQLFHKISMENEHRWKINIETSLNVPEVFVNMLEGVVDHWIVDIKDMNPDGKAVLIDGLMREDELRHAFLLCLPLKVYIISCSLWE